MKFLIRLILFIMVILIFIFVFAGQGLFDGFLPLMEAKGVVTLTFKGGVFELGENEYMIKKSDAEDFLNYMLNAGWVLSGMDEESYVFEKDGEPYRFEREEVLKFFYIFKAD